MLDANNMGDYEMSHHSNHSHEIPSEGKIADGLADVWRAIERKRFHMIEHPEEVKGMMRNIAIIALNLMAAVIAVVMVTAFIGVFIADTRAKLRGEELKAPSWEEIRWSFPFCLF